MLIIDSREKSTLTKLVLQKCEKMNVTNEKKWIEVGDYVIGNTCFEAKSSHDFLSSVMSKRLWTQLDNMDRCYENNFLIIYGSISEALSYTQYSNSYNIPMQTRKQFLTNKFYGALSRILLDSDTKPIWVTNENNAASVIVTTAKMQPMNRPPIKPHIFKRQTTDDVRVNMLATIKGVSDKKAKMLLKKYGSLMEIGDCTKKELCLLEGIGETTADRILSVFNLDKKVKQ